MGLYDALNPERAILYLDMKDSYDEIYGSNLIIGDPYDPTNWIADAGSTLSRLSEAYLGLDALRVESGVLANPNARGLFSTTSGKRYRLALALRNIGASYAAVFSGNMVLNTTSSNFTYLQQDFTAGSALFRLWNQSTAAGQYCDFSNLSLYELRRSCKNQGKLGPATVQLGDGFTSTRFPSQLQKKGMSLDGNDYISIDNAFLPYLGKNFTLAILDKASPTVTECGMIDKSSAGTGKNTPYALWKEPTSNNYVGGIGDGSTFFSAQGPNTPKASVNFSALTYDGSSLTVHSNKTSGTPVSCTASPLNNSSPLIIGAMSTTPVFAYTGSVLGVVIFPYSLSLEQLIELERRMRQNTRIS